MSMPIKILVWKMTIPLINLGKILVWKMTIPLINVRSTSKLRASGCKAGSAKNNLIDGLFSFSQLQNCANTFSSIFNVIHQHTELHTYNEIKIYLEPFLGLKYWKMSQLILSCRLNIIWWREAPKIFDRNSKIVVRMHETKESREAGKFFLPYSTRKISDPPSRGYEKMLPPPLRGVQKLFWPPPNLPAPPTRN